MGITPITGSARRLKTAGVKSSESVSLIIRLLVLRSLDGGTKLIFLLHTFFAAGTGVCDSCHCRLGTSADPDFLATPFALLVGISVLMQVLENMQNDMSVYPQVPCCSVSEEDN